MVKLTSKRPVWHKNNSELLKENNIPPVKHGGGIIMVNGNFSSHLVSFDALPFELGNDDHDPI